MRNKIFLIISSFLVSVIIILTAALVLLESSTVAKLSTDDMKEHKNDKIGIFNEYITNKEYLLRSIVSNKDFINFVHNGQDEKIVKGLFLTMLKANKDIFQMRFIDENGNEVIRVDKSDSKIYLVEENKLQNKKGRYYFVDSIRLDHDQIYFSNFDLNMEHGKIQKPILPTVRVATPVVIGEEKMGIVIININLSKLLEMLQFSSLHNIYLLYGDGAIVFDPSGKHNWSRDFGSFTKIFTLVPKLPKNFHEKSNIYHKDYFITKLSVKTKDNLYLLITPKRFSEQESIQENIEMLIYLLLLLAILGIPLGFILSKYIDGLYCDKVKLQGEKIEHILLNSVVNSTNDLIFYKDKDFKYIGCNEAFEAFVGKSNDEIVGKTDFELFDENHASLFRSMDIKMLEEYKSRINDEWVTYPNGEKKYLHTQKSPFHYNNKGSVGVLGFSRDITKLYETQEQLKKLSYVDELTGCFNRKSYNEKLQEKIDLFKRYEAPFCLAIFDVDDFKSINDTYGHDRGDKVLQSVVAKVRSTIRKTDILFRIGGEEFVILFPKTRVENAQFAADKVLKGIESLQILKDRKVTVSMGLTEVTKDDTSKSIFNRIDGLLYNSKNNGKNIISKG